MASQSGKFDSHTFLVLVWWGDQQLREVDEAQLLSPCLDLHLKEQIEIFICTKNFEKSIAQTRTVINSGSILNLFYRTSPVALWRARYRVPFCDPSGIAWCSKKSGGI